MYVTIGDTDIDVLSDETLIDWFNQRISGNRLRASTARIWVAVVRAFDEAKPPMTVRQMYYALVSAGAIPKTEPAYKSVIGHLLRMRREGAIPYSFISDSTRTVRKPSTWSSLEAYLHASREAYRHALWANQDAYVEIWCEKDALAGVIYEITHELDVPLMVTRGYPSETFVYESAMTLMEQRKPVYLYYFGDHDPSGADIPVNTRNKLRGFGARFNFEQVAVLPRQIEEWHLPTRPTKQSDSRAKYWMGGSVELDAIPVHMLRRLVSDAITQHIDQKAWDAMKKTEELERATFDTVIANVENAGLAPHSVRANEAVGAKMEEKASV